MGVCGLRQLSSCPRMMSLYYWLNDREGGEGQIQVRD